MALSITPASGGSSGGQPATQNPQSVPGGTSIGGASNQSAGVQPGTSKTLLTTDAGGVPLGGAAVTTVNLSAQAQTGTQASTEPQTDQTQHHANGFFLGICALLVVVAIAIFWAIGRSAKNTTDWS